MIDNRTVCDESGEPAGIVEADGSIRATRDWKAGETFSIPIVDFTTGPTADLRMLTIESLLFIAGYKPAT